MWTAREPGGKLRHWEFKTIDDLVNDLGGTDYKIQRDWPRNAPDRSVLILDETPDGSSYGIITRVLIPNEYFDQD